LNKPTRWSYSSLSTYKQCPAKWKFSYIDGISWPESAAMTRGSRMHLMAEEFVNGKVDRVHPEVQKIGPQLLMLKSQGAKTEATWLLKKDWTPTDDPNEAWIKAIVDVHYMTPELVLHVIDYKSGQQYPDHREQLELYGLMGLLVEPAAKRVETAALYMDSGYEGMQSSIIRPMISKMIEPWDQAANEMMADEVYQPRPATHCRWCPYSKAKGGPCEY
jgi:hypothetical protein